MIPLRPLGLGEILDGSISTIRRNPKATLGFTAIIVAVSTVITTAMGAIQTQVPSLRRISERTSAGQALTAADGTWLLTFGIVTLLLALAVNVILTGTLTAVVGRAVLGRQSTVGEAWQQARGRLGALVRLLLLTLGIFAGLWAVLIGVPLAGAAASRPLGVGLAIPAVIAALPVTILLWVRMSLAASVVVLERVNARGAIGRSWRLTRKSFWRVFGIWIVSYLVAFVAALVLQVPFRIIAAVTTGGGGMTFASPPTALPGQKLLLFLIISAVGSLVSATVTRPMIAGVAALLYVDLRMRREGLDIALQTAAAGDDFARIWQPPPRRAGPPW